MADCLPFYLSTREIIILYRFFQGSCPVQIPHSDPVTDTGMRSISNLYDGVFDGSSVWSVQICVLSSVRYTNLVCPVKKIISVTDTNEKE